MRNEGRRLNQRPQPIKKHPVYLLLILLLVRASDKRIQREDEYSDSEDEGEGGRKDNESHRKKKRKLVAQDCGPESKTQVGK